MVMGQCAGFFARLGLLRSGFSKTLLSEEILVTLVSNEDDLLAVRFFLLFDVLQL
jgi:hypothetical protein